MPAAGRIVRIPGFQGMGFARRPAGVWPAGTADASGRREEIRLMAEPAREHVPVGAQVAIYGAGLFSFSQVMISGVVVALFLVELQVSAFTIGIVLGARHFLTLVLSIHGGVTMDRLGTRRVMVACAVASTLTPLLFPFAQWVAVLVALQMIAGLADAMVWMGAQALSGSVMKGNPTYVGRMTFACRIGSFVGPMAAGAAWDLAGLWGAFGFMACWSALGLVSVLRIAADESGVGAAPRVRVRLADLVPRFGDYVSAFSLAAIPAVALVLYVTMIRVGGTGIQNSFYVVYLDGIGISGSAIGLLLGVSGACASVGSLAVGPLARTIHSHWLIVLVVILSVVTIGVTPWLFGLYFLLMFVIGLRGLCLGISQPLEISVLGRAIGAGSQGKGVGLRTTANRVTGTLVPVVMGGVAELVGIENSFLVMGAVMLALMVLIALFVHRQPDLGRDPS
jgi:predicted MFS family arabinose efflux permease